VRLEECDRSPGAETGRDQPGFGEGGWGDNRVPQTLSNLRENDFGFLAAIGSLLRQFSTVSRRILSLFATRSCAIADCKNTFVCSIIGHH
jgi:hypothetical protein